MNIDTLRSATLFGALGLAIGGLHFYGLRYNSRAYLEGGVRARSVAIHLARLLVTAIAFVLIARSGATPLMAAFGGFVVARLVVVARARRLL